MQLATSQRPHPPPVPPRPSRQVVAEALKRSPRPPCPTRQAPPPPNTRPWRSEEKENGKLPKVGRTLVYESGREQQQANGEHERCSSNDLLARTLASPRCSNDETVASSGGSNITGTTVVEKTVERRVGGPTRGTSERNEAENQRERHQQQQQQQQQRPQPRSNGNERCDRENSTTRLSEADSEITGSTDGRSAISYDNFVIREKSVNVVASTGDVIEKKRKRKKNDLEGDAKEEESFEGAKSKSPIGCKVPLIRERISTRISRSVDEYLRNSDREYKTPLDGSVNEKFAKSSENERTEIRNDDAAKSERGSWSFGKKSDCQGEEATGKRLSTTPTKIEKISNNNGKVVGARDENEEPISRRREEEEEDEAAATTMSGSTTTISSDDCATVVVIDEPERKIAFNEDNDNIHHQDWLEAGVRYSSTKITLPGDDPVDRADEFDDDYDVRRAYAELDFSSIRERIAMSSLQGLPPLPRSLSGFNLSEGRREAGEPPPPPARSSSKTPKNVKSTQLSISRPSPPGRQLTTLDTQLAILRKEMFGLRQLDLSLLSQLWSLNESIQEFRQLLQEQEDRAPSPSPSSEEGDDNSYGSHPPPPPRRPAPLLHHHRPPRPPRPLRPPASDDSPSSEEYGAV